MCSRADGDTEPYVHVRLGREARADKGGGRRARFPRWRMYVRRLCCAVRGAIRALSFRCCSGLFRGLKNKAEADAEHIVIALEKGWNPLIKPS